MRVAAIDQGTTSTRCLVLERSGAANIVCTRQHRQNYPQSGWVEHDPLELLQHIRECIDAAGTVSAIGMDNQGESCLAWNGVTGEPVSPVIVWQDRRTEKTIAKLKNQGCEELTITKAGLPLDPYFSASKLAWIIDNIPEAKKLLARGQLHLGTTDAFFIERLTGNYYSDITTASRTSLLNLETGQWDVDLCNLFGVPIEALPEVKPAMTDFGTIETATGSVRLTVSIVDQQASLYGHGCRNTGDAKITFGTGAFALAVTGNKPVRAPDKGLLPTIAWQMAGSDPVYALDGGVYNAASALNWAKSLGLFNDFAAINQFDAPPAITRALVFVPALSGLGCPHWDGTAAGLWIGMALDTTPADMVQSILEGIAFRTGEVIDSMTDLVHLKDSISIDGGMSCNPYFCQFLSNILQKQIVVHSSQEQTVSGTAMMVMGDGTFGDMAAGQCIRYDPVGSHDEGKAYFSEAVRRTRTWRDQDSYAEPSVQQI